MKSNPPSGLLSLGMAMLSVLTSCSEQELFHDSHTTSVGSKPGQVTYALQPFGTFNLKEHPELYTKVAGCFGNVCILPAIALPHDAYYPTTKRYRADKIINHLKTSAGMDTVLIGLTDKDISTTKGTHKDWGVMGLGFQPGRACVVSTFRLNKKNVSEQLTKVVLHEIGHTRGLPHCPEKTCLMRDAKGGNPFDEESGFCRNCKSTLSAKGIKPG